MSSKTNHRLLERFRPAPANEARQEIVKDALIGFSRQAINQTADLLGWPYHTLYSQIDPEKGVRIRLDVIRAALYVTRSEAVKNLLLGPEFLVSLNPAQAVNVKDFEAESMDVVLALGDLVAKLREALMDNFIDGNEAPEIDQLVSRVDEQWAELKKLISLGKTRRSMKGQ